MGEGARAQDLIGLTAEFHARGLDAADAKRASIRGVVGHSLVVAGLVCLPADRYDLIADGWFVAWFVVRTAWAALVWTDRADTLRSALDVLQECAAATAIAVGMFSQGAMAAPLWFVAFARAMAFLPSRPLRVQAAKWSTAVANLSLAGALVLASEVSGGILVLAVGCGLLVTLHVSTNIARERLAMEAESDALHAEIEASVLRDDSERIARELHDGLGAELVGLMLEMRARGGATSRHTENVLTLIEELRSVVWSLRGGRGSVAEFEKLLRARVRVALGDLPLHTHVRPEHARLPVPPDVALAMLTALRDVLAHAATFRELEGLAIALDADPFSMTIELGGVDARDVAQCPPSSTNRDGTSLRVDDAGALRIEVG